jgi:hypothetical protein
VTSVLGCARRAITARCVAAIESHDPATTSAPARTRVCRVARMRGSDNGSSIPPYPSLDQVTVSE